MRFIKPIALTFLLPAFFCTTPSTAATSFRAEARAILAQDTVSWDQKLPFDNEVLTGKLKNGFTYYIRRNVEPEKRVTMYLANKVGSILENEEQLGLAHFLEHMNFNGLKHFPKNELINYLQKAGVRFGSDLNAYTGFDETVYQLPIPSDDPELLKNGLQVMRDWAQDALLTTDEIDKERGIVMEEMRGNRGVSQRLQDKFFPIVLNGSRYSKRLPIGTEKIITTFKPETIRKFHQDWYRPDLQSIIIVGDIDVKDMEARVKTLFSDLKAPAKKLERTKYNVDLLNKNQFIAITDPELPYTVVQIMIKSKEEKTVTVKDYRKELLVSSFNMMVADRFSEIMQQADAPFIHAGGNIAGFIAGLDVFSLMVVPKPGQLEVGFKKMMTEFERIQKFGFTQSELDRAIVAMNKGNETSYIERSKKKSDSYVHRYMNNFLKDEAVLSNDDNYKITKQLLPTLTLKEVNALIAKYYTDLNRDVIIMGPEKDKATLPTEQTVNSWIKTVESENVTAYEDKVSKLPLLSKEPIKGSIVSSKELKDINSKELTLSNGVKVILKPTNFKNDEILITASSPGGSSLYPDQDYFSASNAAGLVDASGIGQLKNVELQKYLTGKNVRMSPYISENYEGLYGSSDKEGLKNTFELVYGYFAEPRLDDDVFQSTIARTIGGLENRENNPSNVFSDQIKTALYGDNIRRKNATIDLVKTIDKNRAFEIYKDRFADASDFTFTIVGSFTEEEIKPYLENYLAALPNLGRKESYKDLRIIEPAQGKRVVVNKGKEDKASVQLAYYGDYAYSEAENINMDALESILTIKLLERLREAESGVYSVGASASYGKLPHARYSFGIGFGTAPSKVDVLIKSAVDEVSKIKKNGPLKEDIDKFVIEQKRQLELQLKENGFWAGYISGSYQNQEDVAEILRRLDDLSKVSVESVKAVADKYLKQERMFEFILLPDAK
ncbi:insulinase family protein [Sphingobacterium sp. SRCM116780]|uniref:M16 family metallopeptidase n=1 Tax=Sphingobacterium sp. SRCM116780 TaxID=2907623 RepID=UPI001F3A4E6E|nr:M16 family metallopeptidase [Sphingobacterium sp. SRCM116780]UIR57980.1 insulinase family protein [Sphingobacterium sp. SRCM116780]